MKFSLANTVFLAAAASLAAAGSSTLDRGDAFFQSGNFAEAERSYSAALTHEVVTPRLEARLGLLALFANHFAEAESRLTNAVSAGPEERLVKNMLGEMFYRQDNFPAAAKWFRAAGSEYRAKPLEAFGATHPYRVEGPSEEAHLKLVVTDPLPIVEARVNGGEPLNFLVDTGASEVVIDDSVALELGIKPNSSVEAIFLGGEGVVHQGRIDSLGLGDFVVKDVPVGIRPLPPFAGRKLSGVIGTVLLYHFLATLDYPRGELVLRRKSAEALEQFEERAAAEKQIEIPFWMAGDHYIVARGRVNHAPPALFYVATGVAGFGLVSPNSTLQEARINLSGPPAARAVESGERVNEFVVANLSLGDATAERIRGLAGAFPAFLEHSLGFRIAGMISHQFFRPYALTLDFTGMRLFLARPPTAPQADALRAETATQAN
jgi:tetratricopeptide (TPR) repeat protein